MPKYDENLDFYVKFRMGDTPRPKKIMHLIINHKKFNNFIQLFFGRNLSPLWKIKFCKIRNSYYRWKKIISDYLFDGLKTFFIFFMLQYFLIAYRKLFR